MRDRTGIWSLLALLTVGGALLSLWPLQSGGAAVPCGSSAPQCGGVCSANASCVALNATACECVLPGCCRLQNSSCSNNVSVTDCQLDSGVQFVPAGLCGGECPPFTPTATPTETATATPTATATATTTGTATATPTKVPNGGSCLDPADCASGNCVDDVCVPDPAQAPATSHTGLLVIALVLTAVAAFAFRRRRSHRE